MAERGVRSGSAPHDQAEARPICAFCLTPQPLVESHIIPKFVYQHLLATSPGRMRNVEAPNRRVQDGVKVPLLCAECEGRFSKWESAFARQVFVPFHVATDATPAYGPWGLKFAASIVWRVATFMAMRDELRHLLPSQMQHLEHALGSWKSFLQAEREHPGDHEIHLYPLDVLDSASGTVSSALNRYLLRGIDMDVISTCSTTVVYAKLVGLVFVGMVQKRYGSAEWRGGKMRVRIGAVPPGVFRMPAHMRRYMNDRASRMFAAMNSLSPRQQQVLSDAQHRDPDATASSEAFRAMTADLALSGQVAFSTYDDNAET